MSSVAEIPEEREDHFATAETLEALAREPAVAVEPAVAPATGQDRLFALDTLRGVAVLGILLMNILFFGMPMVAGFNPDAGGEEKLLNRITWLVNQVLFEGKMRAIFSICFGAGVILLTSRAEKRGGHAEIADVYYRRNLWLIAFGLVHAFFIWAGDILFSYGLVGLFLYPFRKLRPWALITIGTILLIIAFSRGAIKGVMLQVLPEKAKEAQQAKSEQKELTDEQKKILEAWSKVQGFIEPDEKHMKKDLDGHLGGYWNLFMYRAGFVVRMQSIGLYTGTFFDVGSMMLIGMALMKMGVFTAHRSNRFYIIMACIGYGIGIACTGFVAFWAVYKDFELLKWIGPYFLTYPFGRLFVALGHIALIMLICKNARLPRTTAALAAVGRMAFTNYILASLICVILFEGFAFGLFGAFERYQLYLVVFGVWAVQIALSVVWLHFFRFGPLEWAWRALTYWKMPPMLVRRGENLTPASA
ncbi:MAG: DUF418 domain-containing protein [Planctomycetes bacterium]|nr:DUF418 domain-containing protein [Planctomycetota bacterium]